MRILPLLTFALLAACSKEPAAAGAPTGAATPAANAAAAPAEDADCNLKTPLVPGIPGSPGHLIVSKRNPNGDSELAVLMRDFVDDLREVRTKLDAGMPLEPLFPAHRKMRCAWPTKPSERDERYDNLAKGYLGAVRLFDEKPGKATYNAIVQGCISCHSQSCGGPLDFIDSMIWQ
jgi:hypothetical protein